MRNPTNRTPQSNNNSDNTFLKKRDTFILVICCIAVFLSFQTQRFILKETWMQPLVTSNFENLHFPSEKEKLPNPLITDVEGDGINEIVFVTPDFTINIADTITTEKKKHLFDFPLKATASLLSVTRLTAGRRPIALAAGYLTPLETLHHHDEETRDSKMQQPLNSTSTTREQYIVVVTDGWVVMCFNNQLKLMWESHMRGDFPPDSYTSETAVMLVPKPIRINDQGSVIVGARLRSNRVENIQHEHGETITHGHKEAEGESQPNENEEHFSYYAFDGKTGALRWKHEQGDFFDSSSTERHNEEGEAIFGYMPEHSYKLHVWSSVTSRHQGEVDWRLFKHDMFHQMPHFWESKYDTHFDLYHFTKRRTSGGGSVMDEKTAWSVEDLGVPLSHIPGLPFGGEAPHVASDHIVKPNVVVSHTKSGIEIIHLYTGRTLCTLPLPSQALYADLNGDGILDSVKVTALEIESEEHGGQDSSDAPCDILATSGIPPIEALFNGSICDPLGGLLANVFLDSATEKKQRQHQTPTNPVVIESSRSSTMMNVHSEHELDTVFLVSSGRMTSFRPNGKVNWQLDTPALWMKKDLTLSNRRKRIEAAKKKGPEIPIFPSLSTLSLEAYGDSKYLLAIGNAAALVSPAGELLASLPLFDAPMSPPVIGDFNNDGINDFILVTARSYRGYTIHSSTGYGFLPFLIVLIVVCIVMLIAITNYSQPPPAKKRAVD